MTRKLKILGLTLLALLAITAVVASAASAAQFHSESTSGTTFLTGTQVGTNQFDLANGTPVKCTGVVLDSSYAGTTASDLTVTPTYTGCTAAGQKAEIKTNGCTYTTTTLVLVELDKHTILVHVVCPAGKSIEVNVPTAGCSVKMAAQTGGGLIHITTETTFLRIFRQKYTVSISYTTTGGGICGAAGSANLTGEVSVKGYKNAAHTEQVSLWVA
jgi:hypothetical protein